jgi:hypothetical protein
MCQWLDPNVRLLQDAQVTFFLLDTSLKNGQIPNLGHQIQCSLFEPQFLVGGLEHVGCFFRSVGNFRPSQLTKSIIFQMGWLKPPTRKYHN